MDELEALLGTLGKGKYGCRSLLLTTHVQTGRLKGEAESKRDEPQQPTLMAIERPQALMNLTR
jgi:hypothetical protein